MDMRTGLVLFALVILAPSLSATTGAVVDGHVAIRSRRDAVVVAFDESVWGKNAVAVRTVAMTITPTGDCHS
jgi:hypothetical protein